MIPRMNCKYYKEGKLFSASSCEKHKDLKCIKCKCNDYISKYTRTDCVNYREDFPVASERCKVLRGEAGDVPCACPRIKKNGKPVLCTFYDKR